MSTAAPAWHGTDVGVGEVLEQLRSLRARAGRPPRSSVLDVIIIASDAGEAEAAAAAVEKLAAHHPCRALVVLDELDAGKSRIDVTITEHGEPGPGQAPAIARLFRWRQVSHRDFQEQILEEDRSKHI